MKCYLNQFIYFDGDLIKGSVFESCSNIHFYKKDNQFERKGRIAFALK